MSEYDISKAFEEIEKELIDSMMKNFSRHRAEELKEGYNWSQWQAEQLKSLEQYRKNNSKKFLPHYNLIEKNFTKYTIIPLSFQVVLEHGLKNLLKFYF